MKYEELDPGIRETVRWLNENQFITTDSGDGVTKVGSDMEGVIEEPHVMIRCASASSMINDAFNLANLLRAKGVTVTPGMIQASFDPVDMVAIIALLGVNDTMLKGGDNA